MKIFKKILIGILCLPFVLIFLYILFEIIGMWANHAATDKQTKNLESYLERQIEDITIMDVHSETGNTSGTGNHVECLTEITFSTEKTMGALEVIMSRDYRDYEIISTEEGYYRIRLVTSAPFADNLEGH